MQAGHVGRGGVPHNIIVCATSRESSDVRVLGIPIYVLFVLGPDLFRERVGKRVAITQRAWFGTLSMVSQLISFKG